MAEELTPELHAAPGRDVFISYASQDAPVATTMVEALEKQGIKCWIAPRDVRPGTVYADAIVGAIYESKALVLVLSANAMPSAHVGREVERAASKHKQLIAFRVDAAPLSQELEYFLSNSQWIDVPKLGMPAALGMLAGAVRQGPATTPQALPVGSSAGGSKRKIAIVAAVVGVGVAVAVGVHFWSLNHSSAQTPAVAASAGVPAKSAAGVVISDKSIAVLPFVDMSEKKDQEYFSDGLSEELIDMLTKVPDLRVPARTSSFYFKGKQATIADIAKALGVAHLLEGSVRRSGNTVRITVQLIRADSGYHIWSETYDRQLGDLFKIQDDIANSVIRALKMSLLNGTPSPAPKTANSDAYTLELKGRYFLNRRGTGGIDKAVDYLQQAVKLDPNFAEGWARLSTALMVRSQGLGLTPWRSAREEALAAAERALALDPNLAYAHLAIARIRFVDGKWQEAQESYERARSLDPNRGLEVGAWLAQSRGELDEAIQLLERHAVQEPLDVYSYNALADVYYQAGRLPEAEATARKAVELEPSAVGVPVMLGQILVARGAAEEGIAEIKRDPDERNRNYGLAWAFQTLGRKADADAALSDLERTSATTLPSSIAAIYAMRNERDQAFAWLERAYQHQDDLSDLAVDPDFKNLRDDPRFKAFLRKMNLPE